MKINKSISTSHSKIENPYLKGAEGRAEWNDRYMNMKKMVQRWQIAFFSMVILSLVLSLVIAKIATESKVEPYVVETNNGMPYAIKPVTPISSHDPKLINFSINQFIINARTVVNDHEAEKLILNKLYAYAANNAIGILHDFYAKNNPFDRAKQYTVTVNIVNSLPMSKQSWQITWDEIKHSTQGGNILETTRWVANITYKLGNVNPRFIADNPFGIYITDISWAQNQS